MKQIRMSKPAIIKAQQVNYIVPENITDIKSAALMLNACNFYSRYDTKMTDKMKELQEKIDTSKLDIIRTQTMPTSYNEAYRDRLEELGLL